MPRETKKTKTHRKIVQEFLAEYPGCTVPEIRDGVEARYDFRIERVQARLNEIAKHYHLSVDTSGELAGYTLGERRAKPRGQGTVRVRLPDVLHEDTEVADLRAHLKAAAEDVRLISGVEVSPAKVRDALREAGASEWWADRHRWEPSDWEERMESQDNQISFMIYHHDWKPPFGSSKAFIERCEGLGCHPD